MTLKKAFTPLKPGIYSACKSHVFERNKAKGRPQKSILSIAVYERPSKKAENVNNEKD